MCTSFHCYLPVLFFYENSFGANQILVGEIIWNPVWPNLSLDKQADMLTNISPTSGPKSNRLGHNRVTAYSTTAGTSKPQLEWEWPTWLPELLSRFVHRIQSESKQVDSKYVEGRNEKNGVQLLSIPIPKTVGKDGISFLQYQSPHYFPKMKIIHLYLRYTSNFYELSNPFQFWATNESRVQEQKKIWNMKIKCTTPEIEPV